MKSVYGLSLTLLILSGCTSATKPTPQPPAAPAPVAQPQPPSQAPIVASPITNAKLSADSFNPSKDKPVVFTFTAPKAGAYMVKVWDADGGLIRTLAASAPKASAEVPVSWDGKDDQGQIVPDEAYTFTVFSAAGEALYNPFATSGGQRIDITQVDWRPEEQRLIYTLPYPCRMLVRAGTKPGPLLANIVDWEPRKAGEIREVWRGMDASGKIFVPTLPNFILTASGFSLPDCTIIINGNSNIDFKSYRHQYLPGSWLQIKSNARTYHSQYGTPLLHLLSPKLLVASPDGHLPTSISLHEGEVININLSLDSDTDPLFRSRPYEIMFYIDGEPLMEEGHPFMPYIFPLKASYFTKGRHVFTINASNATNQFAAFSFAVRKE